MPKRPRPTQTDDGCSKKCLTGSTEESGQNILVPTAATDFSYHPPSSVLSGSSLTEDQMNHMNTNTTPLSFQEWLSHQVPGAASVTAAFSEMSPDVLQHAASAAASAAHDAEAAATSAVAKAQAAQATANIAAQMLAQQAASPQRMNQSGPANQINNHWRVQPLTGSPPPRPFPTPQASTPPLFSTEDLSHLSPRSALPYLRQPLNSQQQQQHQQSSATAMFGGLIHHPTYPGQQPMVTNHVNPNNQNNALQLPMVMTMGGVQWAASPAPLRNGTFESYITQQGPLVLRHKQSRNLSSAAASSSVGGGGNTGMYSIIDRSGTQLEPSQRHIPMWQMQNQNIGQTANDAKRPLEAISQGTWHTSAKKIKGPKSGVNDVIRKDLKGKAKEKEKHNEVDMSSSAYASAAASSTSSAAAAAAAASSDGPFVRDRKCQGAPDCPFMAAVNRNVCRKHAGHRCCKHAASVCARSPLVGSQFCRLHGGGVKCEVKDCPKVVDLGERCCPKHNGSKRCQSQQEYCERSAIGSTQFCKRHGGGKRCQAPGGCTKSSQGATAFCIRHGGGKRCEFPDGCDKSAIGRTSLCKRHGGGKRCQHDGCDKSAEGATLRCIRHGKFLIRRLTLSFVSLLAVLVLALPRSILKKKLVARD
jgi:hypothetical protein